MLRGRRAGISTALAIVATAAAVSGCGGGRSNALSLDPVAAAATKTLTAGAARVRFTLEFSNPQLRGGKASSLRGAGAIDGTSSELTIGSNLRQAGIPAGASLKEISLQQNGDYVVYVQLGALASQLPSGKHWISLDVSKLGKSAGLDLGKLMSGNQLQPGDLLSMLEAEGAKVQKVGPETVDGAATTHYRVTIDVAKALQAKGLTSPLLAGAVAQMPTIPEDVWIGQDGLVHRIRIQSRSPLKFGMTMDLYDYGANVTIAAPPSSDVFDATSLAQQGLGNTLP